MVPPTILAEPFSECMVLGICIAFATRVLFRWDPIVVFLIHLLIWCILDWFLLRSVQVIKKHKLDLKSKVDIYNETINKGIICACVFCSRTETSLSQNLSSCWHGCLGRYLLHSSSFIPSSFQTSGGVRATINSSGEGESKKSLQK